jgi:hypothetical protein
MLVARKFLAKAGDDLSDKHPGDPIPEAAKWPNLRMYLQHKWIEEVADVGVALAEKPPSPAVVAPPPAQVAEVTSTQDRAADVPTLAKSEPLPQIEQPRRRGRQRKS